MESATLYRACTTALARAVQWAAPRQAVAGAAVVRDWELLMKLRTCAIFKSDAFNTPTPKPEFAQPENFGDDLASWFMGKLRAREVTVDEGDPSQEDHGWYLTFKLNDLLYDLVVTHVPGDGTASRWLACIERSVGLLRSMVGQRHRSVTIEVVELINEVLLESQECRDVRRLFFDDVRRGNLENGSAVPLSE